MSDFGQWISVKERLPDRYELVIVCFDGHCTGCGRIAWVPKDQARWIVLESPKGRTVTHWMPFPAPPGREAITTSGPTTTLTVDCSAPPNPGHEEEQK